MLEFVSTWAYGKIGLAGSIILFLIGFAALIKGGDWFVDGATGIAKRFHIPELLIGATVVSIGTTLPEVMVSATSAAKGIGSIAYGNAIGSVICNTALIAALTVAIMPAPVNRKTLSLPVICFFIAALFYCCVAIFAKRFTRPVGIILLAMFVVYMVISVLHALKHPDDAEEEETGKELTIAGSVIFLILGAALIAIGANFLVDNGTIIARYFGVPETVIALTFVALGTSLPELVTAITSLVKGHGALSLGNVIGANIFNIVLVSGMAVTIAPFDLPSAKTIGGMNASLIVDIPVMLTVMALLTIPALITGKLKRWQGITLLAIYVGFLVFQFCF
ncbi:MAG: calcium/sodium antiporter [Clostridiales bacterium]|nr:calcium/sodium antiporter [Clostridiales bacterium]